MVLFFHLVTVVNCNLFPYTWIALSVVVHPNCCRKHRLSCIFLSKSDDSTKKQISQEFKVYFNWISAPLHTLLVCFFFFLWSQNCWTGCWTVEIRKCSLLCKADTERQTPWFFWCCCIYWQLPVWIILMHVNWFMIIPRFIVCDYLNNCKLFIQRILSSLSYGKTFCNDFSGGVLHKN